MLEDDGRGKRRWKEKERKVTRKGRKDQKRSKERKEKEEEEIPIEIEGK